jgi:hypothetical protein
VNGSLLNKKEELETMAETIENIGNGKITWQDLIIGNSNNLKKDLN